MMNVIHKIKIFPQRFSLLLVVGSFFLFSDCKRSTEDLEILGPEYVSAPAGFYVNGGSFVSTWAAKPFAINFLSDSVKFNASFSHKVSWTITITGLSSGAVREITGLSNSLNNAGWKGQTSNIYFFNKETSIAVLSFLGSAITFTDTIPINKPIKYDGKTINGVKHTLLDDFDGLGITVAGQYKDAGDGSTNILEASDEFKVQGNYSLHMWGTDLNSNTWLSGINSDTLNMFPGLVTTSDPAQLYFNIYLYGTGKEGTMVQLKAYEMDAYTNFTYPYDQTTNDGYVYNITVSWTGWRLISARYSDFKRASDPLLGGNGNGIKETRKISGVNVGLNSDPLPAKEVEVYVDYFILTEGGRFIP